MASELHLGDSNWKLFQVGYPVDIHTRLGRRDIKTAVKNSLEIIIKQAHLEGCFKRGGRIRVDECLRQIVPNTCASITKRSFTKCFCVYTRGDKGSCVGCELVIRGWNGYRNPNQHRKVDPREHNSPAAPAWTRTLDLLIPRSVL